MILKGVKSFGFDRSERYISPTGSRTIDHFSLSNDLRTVNVLDSHLVDSSFVESNRLPVSLTVKIARAGPQGREP